MATTELRTRLGLAGWAVLWLAAVFMGLSLYLQPGVNLDPGLDSSWAYALNYIFQHKLVVGRDIYFTFGPLGFLEHTRALTHELIYASGAFWFAVSVLLFAGLLRLAWLLPVPAWHRVLNLLLVLGLAYLVSTHIMRLLMLSYVLLLLHWLTRHTAWLVGLAVVTALCLLIKFSYGVVALSMVGPYWLLASWRERSLLPGLLSGVALVATYAGCWYLVYGHVEGMLGYIQGGLSFSKGSTTAMAQNPDNEWVAIGLYYLAYAWALLVLGREQATGRWPLSLCFIGPLFIWTKYAFGREDNGHLVFLMLFILYLFPVLALASRQIGHVLRYGVALGLGVLGWYGMHTPETGPAVPLSRPVFFTPDTFASRWKPDRLIGIWQEESVKRLAPLAIPPALREQIGQRPVDIYPWENLVVAANDLHWVPRPVFQNYITYTPFLDQANATFISSDRAPDFFLWHYHSFADIDNRYPLSSDPLTLLAMLGHYSKRACDGIYCLWERTPASQWQAPVMPSAVTVAWEDWIPVPSLPVDVIHAALHIERTWLGKLNLALWKEGGVSIDYRLNDGRVETHRLLVENAVSGAWVSPYLHSLYTSTLPQALTRETLQAWLGATPAAGYIEKAEPQPGGVRVLGWGLIPYRDTHTQTVQALLSNDTHAYTFQLAGRHRPGITAHFGKTGEVDLEQSGFDALVPTSQVEPGTYELRFVVEQGGVRACSEHVLPVTIAAHPMHNVQAIRLHTTRPWAFDPKIGLQWVGRSFQGETPW